MYNVNNHFSIKSPKDNVIAFLTLRKYLKEHLAKEACHSYLPHFDEHIFKCIALKENHYLVNTLYGPGAEPNGLRAYEVTDS